MQAITINSMVYWPRKEADQWYIDLETGLHMSDRPSINLVSRRGGPVVYTPVNYKENGVQTAIRKRKTDGKETKDTQNILLDGCYHVFEEYLQEHQHQKKPVFVTWHCAKKKVGQRLEESLERLPGNLVKNVKIFWINN